MREKAEGIPDVIGTAMSLDDAEVEVEVSEAFLRAAGTEVLAGELEHARELRARSEHVLKEIVGCSLTVSVNGQVAGGGVPLSPLMVML